MNGDAVLDLLMGRLGSRTSTNLRATALLEMAGVQDRLERTALSFHPWFLFTDDTSTVTTAADTETAALPSDFLGMQDEWDCVFYQDTSRSEPDQWVKLGRKSYGDLKAEYYDSTTNAPEKYDVIDNNLYLRPVPDDTYQIRLLYYAQDSAPTDAAAENEWLKWAWELLLAETGNLISTKHLRDAEIAQVFVADMVVLRKELFRTHERKLHELMDYHMGDE